MECPLSKPEVGNGTWQLLHTIAAYYPESPTDKDKSHYEEFFTTFSYVYPCRPCAQNFQKLVQENPPILDSRITLSIWLCKMHNVVNTMLGKDEFKCTMKELDMRWKRGPSECYEASPSELDIVY